MLFPVFFVGTRVKKPCEFLSAHRLGILDNQSHKKVVASDRFPAKEFDALMEELEDIRLYDEAKKEDTGERILFSDYLKDRKQKSV